MKKLFIDVETTGLNPDVHAVFQISGEIEIDGKMVEQFDFRARPHKGAIADKKALEVTGITRSDLLGYPSNIEVHSQLTALLGKYVDKYDKKDKFFLYAYNASFDNSFMWSFFQNVGDPYWGSWVWSGYIDVMVLAAERMQSERHTMENFKLMTVAKKLGIPIEEDKLHDSLYDIELTKKVYEFVKF